MPPRTNTLADARGHLDWLRTDAGRELRLARHNAGLTLAAVGTRVGCSKAKVSRIERGTSRGVTLEDLVLIAAVVGLRPSLRFFPTGRPIRDIGQVELLATLTARMHPRWSHRHEVPMPLPGDLRAADQVSSIEGCRLMIEAYRRFTDAQAQVRAARSKQRDLGADRLLILVEDTNANRRAVAASLPALRPSFPVPARAFIAALAAGVDPGGDGIVLLRRAPSARSRVSSGETKEERRAVRPSSVSSGATPDE
jgi:transcriptional regulator with XRE-family HTH domain